MDNNVHNSSPISLFHKLEVGDHLDVREARVELVVGVGGGREVKLRMVDLPIADGQALTTDRSLYLRVETVVYFHAASVSISRLVLKFV